MTATTTPATVPSQGIEPSVETPPKPAGKRVSGPNITGGGRDARRFAAAILEVMAGIRTPTDAAAALGITMQRYYILEKRALEGMVTACEPRPKGPPHRADKDVERLRLEVARLQQDVARNQALARAAQRTIGLAPPVKPAAQKGTGPGKGKKHRRRRPVVRALKVIDRLQSQPITSDGQTTAGPGPTVTDGSS
jgi:hypothetical protein